MPCTSRIETINGTVVTDEATLMATLKTLGWSHEKIGLSYFITPKTGAAFELRKTTTGYNAIDASSLVGKLNVAYRTVQVQGWAKKQGFMFQSKPGMATGAEIKLQKY
mgnify:FL=1